MYRVKYACVGLVNGVFNGTLISYRTQNDILYQVVPESQLYHIKEIEDVIRVCLHVVVMGWVK